MKENNTFFNKTVLWLEFAYILIIPFVIWWATTPTNVLNSNSLYKLLEIVGVFGSGLLPIGIPIGIIGIITSKKMIKLRKTTVFLSIVNLSVGIIAILMMLLILCAVIFGGASV